MFAIESNLQKKNLIWQLRWMVDYGGTFIAKILFLYLSEMNILGLKFSCKNSHLSAHKMKQKFVSNFCFIKVCFIFY